MTQVRIVCLAHPNNWAAMLQKNNLTKTLLNISENSSSWADKKGRKGSRLGIIKKPYFLNDKRFLVIPFVWEKTINLSNSIESLLESEVVRTETSFQAIVSHIVLDTIDGVAYVVDKGHDIPSFEKIKIFFERLSKDTKISFFHCRLFGWDKKKLEDFATVAMGENFVPHKVRGMTDLVRILAEGDLLNDVEWNRIQNMIQNSSWSTVAFLHNNAENKFVFGLIKSRNIISIRGTKDPPIHEVISKATLIRNLFEKTLGTTLNHKIFYDYTN